MDEFNAVAEARRRLMETLATEFYKIDTERFGYIIARLRYQEVEVMEEQQRQIESIVRIMAPADQYFVGYNRAEDFSPMMRINSLKRFMENHKETLNEFEVDLINEHIQELEADTSGDIKIVR